MRGKAEATLVLEEAILEIAAERRPITVRGIAYALFVRGLIPSMEVKHTQRVSRITAEMRESGTLPWEWIVDGSRSVRSAQTWDDPDAILHAAVRGYRRDNWQDQPTIVEVWSEKSTVEGVLAPVLDELGVDFQVMKGFGSATALKRAAVNSNRIADRDQKTVVLYVGDWDPSGMYMSEVDLPERLARYGGNWRVKRIAIVRADHHLPHFDARTKTADARYRWFVERYGRRCWELDAMDPNDLRDRVRKEIESYIDWTLLKRAIEIEKVEVASMKDFHKAWRSRLTGGKRRQ
jgi:hypothetical protein